MVRTLIICNILLDLTRQSLLKNKHARGTEHTFPPPQKTSISPLVTSQKHCHGKCQSDDQILDEPLICHALRKPLCLPWGGSSY